MRNQIPYLLIVARFVFGVIILVCSLVGVNHFSVIAITLLTLGLISDIFDGIVARNLGVSTPRLRKLDSNVDQFFFLSVAVATFIYCPDFLLSHSLRIGVLIAFEAVTYLFCYLKFRKEIATHTLGAKGWTLVLFATLIEILVHCESTWLFSMCFWIGLITRIEIIAILGVLKTWTHDVPTVYHAWHFRQGKKLPRNTFFNG